MSSDNGTILKKDGDKYVLYYYHGEGTDKITESEKLEDLLELVENAYSGTKYGLSLGGFAK